MDLKRELATRIVARLHGEAAAAAASEHFRRVVQEGGRPAEIPQRTIEVAPGGEVGLLDILRTAFELASNGEARRLVTQGAVQLDEKTERDPMRRLRQGSYIVKAGRRRFVRVEIRVFPEG
jgi:tyrosyl-tRNA synthetase